MLIIGIDPAYRKAGFACCFLDTTEKTARFKIFKNGLLDFLNFLLYEAPDIAFWSIENSNLQKMSFGANSFSRGLSVGKNQAVSQMTVDILRIKYGNNNVIEYSPKEKGAKLDAQVFLQYAESYTLENYKKTQDERDAGKLALLAVSAVRIRQYVIKHKNKE